MRTPSLTYGIEEEFFLIEPESRRAVTQVPDLFMRTCRSRFGERVQEEMLRSQVETSTPVLHNAATARETLTELRCGINRIAEAMEMRLLAAGTHPLAAWGDQLHTDKLRYDQLMDDFQIVGQRNLLCGLHVHVAIPEHIDRIALMNRLMPWLPVFLALSTSSPFWNQRRTGLLSYRQAAYDEWPRSGVPDAFADETEYAAFVDLLTQCGALRDGSFLWWAIRPSARFPTLELRITDACTHIEDALAIAAAFRCLVRAHIRCPTLGAVRTALTRRVIDENRWRAKRYGTQAAFIDEAIRCTAPFDDVLSKMLELIAPDAEALRCEDELRHLARIPRRGTSAHNQLAIYHRHREQGKTPSEALRPVVDWLSSTTAAPAERHASNTVAIVNHLGAG